MKLPLEISAKNVHLSEEIEDTIREKAQKLENFYDQIIRCRVKVDIPHRSQRSGAHYCVRIDLTVPGGELVVKREPGENLQVAVGNSFEAAERQLKAFADRQRGEVKRHEERPCARISKIFPDEGYGFLTTPEGREVYFHENAVLNGKFKDLTIGTPVFYVEGEGEKGARASTLTIA